MVEDLEYHLRLVRAGRRVWFADATTVRADMPVGGHGVRTQRARWEGGRLRMIAEMAPPLLREVVAGRRRLLEPLLELLLLPLAFHVVLLGLALLVPVAAAKRYVRCKRMKLSNIRRLIDGDLSPAAFRAEYAGSVDNYSRLLRTKGSAVPILVEEDTSLTLSNGDVKLLCSFFLQNDLSSAELAYVADVLQLAEAVNYEKESLADVIQEFTDPGVNGPFSKARATAIMNEAPNQAL